MRVFCDVGPTLISEIAQEPNFAAVAGFACGDEVKPAVVIVIDRRNPPTALPGEIGKRDAHEFSSVHITPQADAGRSCVGEGEVHPAVFIKVKSDHANGRGKIFYYEIDRGKRSEFAFARIQINGGAFGTAGENKINSAIIVEVGGDEACASGGNAKCGVDGNVRESIVAVVAPQSIVWETSVHGGSDIQIEIAVVVVVHEGDGDAAFF